MAQPLFNSEEFMSDAKLVQDAEVAVEAATSEDSFDALAFFSNAALPEDTVTVYQDSKTAFALAVLAEKAIAQREAQKEQDEEEGLSLTDEAVEYIDPDEVAALKAKLNASAVIF